MTPAQYINQTSGRCEYYTPSTIIEAARSVMGGIDLDPASSPAANEIVHASRIFTADDDGLAHRWEGRVWLNHPFGRRENPLWIGKLFSDYMAGHVTQACCITYACTSEQWFAPLMQHPQCYLQPRTNYLLPAGSVKRGVPKGSVVTYLGGRVRSFAYHFRGLGSVMLPEGMR